MGLRTSHLSLAVIILALTQVGCGGSQKPEGSSQEHTQRPVSPRPVSPTSPAQEPKPSRPVNPSETPTSTSTPSPVQPQGQVPTAVIRPDTAVPQTTPAAPNVQAPPRSTRDPSQFRPNPDGFRFANYGREKNAVELIPANVERLCGRGSCERGTGANCVLTGAMRTFMDSVNREIAPGHCEGLASLSQSIFMGHVPLNYFDPQARTTYDLSFNNRTLQAEIAFYAATMNTHPGGTSEKKVTPNQVLEELRKNRESYGLGLYKSDGSDGHAVVAIKVIDQNERLSFIDIYDSNSPGSEEHIRVDTSANTWSYEDYRGNASTRNVTLLPLSPRLVKQECSVWGNDDDEDSESRYYGRRWQVWIDGPGKIEAPSGARVVSRRAFNESNIEPIYELQPGDIDLLIKANPSQKTSEKSNIVVLKQGQAFMLEGISLQSGHTDKLRLTKDGEGFIYTTKDKKPVTLRLGETYSKDDFAIKLYPTPVQGGFELRVINTIERVKGEHSLAVSLKNMNAKAGSYTVDLTRIGVESDEHFLHRRKVKIGPLDTHRLQYGKWLKDKQPLTIVHAKGEQQLKDED